LQHVDLSAPTERPPPVDPAASAPTAARERRSSRFRVERRTVLGLRRLSVLVLVLGLLTTAATTIWLQHVVNDSEQRALDQRAREATLVLDSVVADYQQPMEAGSAVLKVTGPNPTAFSLLASPLVGPGKLALSAALLRVTTPGRITSPPVVTARVGAPLALTAAPGTVVEPLNGDFTLVNLLHSNLGRRVGIVLGAPTMPAGYALYVEVPFPLPEVIAGKAGAFADLENVVYIGNAPRPSDVLFSTTSKPITGERVERIVPFGNSSLLLVVAPKGHLSGALTVALPWLMLAIVLIGTTVGTIAVEAVGRRRDDAVEVAAELEQRSADLISAQAELAVMNAGLEHEVELRTSELRTANRELEAFAYAVSHDLRAPLRAIDGFSLALLEDQGERLDESGRDHLNRVRAATSRMSDLIDDILALSRVTRGDMQRQLVDLSAMSREILAEFAELEPTRTVEIVVPDSIFARGDARLLRVAIENLLANAWKFTGPVKEARIEVGKLSDRGTTTYFVRDNGVGFDGEHAGNLFAPFKRLHSMDEFEGNGIGLATVARVIERHGGHVWARSSPGAGATFYFTCGGMNGEQA
jgi:signal transduction histidine kinase